MSADPLSREERDLLIRISPGGFDFSMTHRWEATVREAEMSFHAETVEAERRAEAAEERAEALRAALVEIAETGECECTVSWVCLSHQANDALMFDDERIASRGEG